MRQWKYTNETINLLSTEVLTVLKCRIDFLEFDYFIVVDTILQMENIKQTYIDDFFINYWLQTK